MEPLGLNWCGGTARTTTTTWYAQDVRRWWRLKSAFLVSCSRGSHGQMAFRESRIGWSSSGFVRDVRLFESCPGGWRAVVFGTGLSGGANTSDLASVRGCLLWFVFGFFFLVFCFFCFCWW